MNKEDLVKNKQNKPEEFLTFKESMFCYMCGLLFVLCIAFYYCGRKHMVDDLCHKNMYDFCQAETYTIKEGFF